MIEMKKLTIVLYVVLFLAIGGIYLLHFTGNRKGISSVSAGAPSLGNAYVNIDSLIYKFDMFTDKRADLLVKQQKAEAELNSKGTQYEKGARDYQDKVNKGLVTRATAAQIEQSLLQQQQELVNLRDNLSSNLMNEEQVMNRQIIDYIMRFLEDNKADFPYQYIFGKSFGNVILYSDTSLDITQKVLDGINLKYRSEKK